MDTVVKGNELMISIERTSLKKIIEIEQLSDLDPNAKLLFKFAFKCLGESLSNFYTTSGKFREREPIAALIGNQYLISIVDEDPVHTQIEPFHQQRILFVQNGANIRFEVQVRLHHFSVLPVDRFTVLIKLTHVRSLDLLKHFGNLVLKSML